MEVQRALKDVGLRVFVKEEKLKVSPENLENGGIFLKNEELSTIDLRLLGIRLIKISILSLLESKFVI